MRNKAINLFGILLLVVVITSFASSTSAQARRKTAKPLATPVPVLTGAEIISRADDQNDTIVVPQPTTTGQKPTSPANTAANGVKRKELNDRVKKLEAAQKPDPDEKQKRLLL